MTPLSWLRWVLRAVTAVVVAAVAVVGFTAFRVWSVAREDHRPSSDVILVLGASQLNGRPSEVLAARLDHAAALFKAKAAPRIVTVGGKQEGDRFTEAEAGRHYLEELGVPAAAVVAVGQGHDTLTSLQAAAVELERHHWRTAVIVTDPWHSLRSRTIARDLGLEATTSPARTGPAVRSRSIELHYIVRETGAYLDYQLRHRVGRVVGSS